MRYRSPQAPYAPLWRPLSRLATTTGVGLSALIPLARRALASGCGLALLVAAGFATADEDLQPLEIATLEREEPVDFATEIYPILQRNCIACHNASDAESGLSLETPAQMLEGGYSGPALVAEAPAESLLLQLAAHQAEPIMPPADNSSGAKPLTPEELGLIQLWIQQGATGEAPAEKSATLAWQPLPSGVNPIYAVALTGTGQLAACGRANQIFLYDLLTNQALGRLTDPQLLEAGVYEQPGVAHLDLVQSLAFAPGGRLLASGGYRCVKLWQPAEIASHFELAASGQGATCAATDPTESWLAVGGDRGHIELWQLPDKQPGPRLIGHTGPVADLQFIADRQQLASVGTDGSLRLWQLPGGELIGQVDLASGITSLAVIDAERLAIGAEDGAVRLVAAPQSGTRQLLAGAQTTAVATGHTAGTVWVARQGGVLDLLNLADGQLVRSIPTEQERVLAVLATVDDGVLSLGNDGIVKRWGADGSLEHATEPREGAVTLLALPTEPQSYVLVQTDGTWLPLDANLQAGEPVADQRAERVAITAAAAADGGQIYLAYADGTLTAFTAEGTIAWSVTTGGPISTVAVDPTGQLLATAGADRQVRLFTASGSPASLPAVTGFTAQPRTLHFTAAGRLVVGTSDRQVLLIDPGSGQTIESFNRHQGGLTQVVPLADGQLVTAGDDHNVFLWQPRVQAVLTGHSAAVTTLGILPGEPTQLASGSRDGTARLWNVPASDAASEAAVEFDHGAAIIALATKAGRLATVGADQSVKLWDPAAETKLLAELRGDADLNREVARLAALLPVSEANTTTATEQLAAAEQAVTDRTTDLEQARTAATEAETALAAARDSATKLAEAKTTADQLATTSEAEATEAQAAATAAEEQLVAAQKPAETSTAAAKAGEQSLVSARQAAESATAAVTATEALAALATDDADVASLVTATQEAAAQATAIVTSIETTQARLAELVATRQAALEQATARRDEALQLAQAKQAAAAEAKKQQEAAAKAATDAETTAKTAEETHQAALKTITDAEAGLERARGNVPTATASLAVLTEFQNQLTTQLEQARSAAATAEQPVTDAQFSPDGMQLALSSQDGTVRIYAAATGKPVTSFSTGQSELTGLCWTNRLGLIAAASDGQLTAWNPGTQWQLSGLIGPQASTPEALAESPLTDRVLALDFSPDGALLATGGGEPSRGGDLKIWRAADRSLLHDLAAAHSDTIFAVAFSPDGRFLATCGADKFVKVFDVVSGELVRSFEGHTHHVLDVAWQHNGHRLASAGADNSVKIWNVDTGEQERTIGGFGKQVTAVRFVGETSQVLSSAADKVVRLHEANDGKGIRNFGGGTDFMYSVAVSDDGTVVLSGGADSVLRLWNLADAAALGTFAPPATDEEAKDQQAAR